MHLFDASPSNPHNLLNYIIKILESGFVHLNTKAKAGHDVILLISDK